MANAELSAYVSAQRAAGVSAPDIVRELQKAGWPDADITEIIQTQLLVQSQQPIAQKPTAAKHAKGASRKLIWVFAALFVLSILFTVLIVVPFMRYSQYASMMDKVGQLQKQIKPYVPPQYQLTDIAKKEDLGSGRYGYFTRMKDTTNEKNLITFSMKPKKDWTCPTKGTWSTINAYKVCIFPLSGGSFAVWDKNSLTVEVVANNTAVSQDELKKVIESI
jgi:hypothetical protein